jgi:hypothetical protein
MAEWRANLRQRREQIARNRKQIEAKSRLMEEVGPDHDLKPLVG